jgi:hypothetical protein
MIESCAANEFLNVWSVVFVVGQQWIRVAFRER